MAAADDGPPFHRTTPRGSFGRDGPALLVGVPGGRAWGVESELRPAPAAGSDLWVTVEVRDPAVREAFVRIALVRPRHGTTPADRDRRRARDPRRGDGHTRGTTRSAPRGGRVPRSGACAPYRRERSHVRGRGARDDRRAGLAVRRSRHASASVRGAVRGRGRATDREPHVPPYCGTPAAPRPPMLRGGRWDILEPRWRPLPTTM